MRLKYTIMVMFCVAVAGGAYALHSGAVRIPDRWNPWAPLDIEEPPGWLTRFKLARLSQDEPLCRAVLADSTLRYQPVEDRQNPQGCGFDNAVRITRTSAQVGDPFTLTCRSAVSLAMWEQHVLQPAALAHFGRRVARLEHFGSYSCRNVYGGESGRLSNHATADALDVAGFVIEGGHRVRVVNDWRGEGTDAAFLRDIHRGACLVFDGVLGPDYNAAHRDHFHFDRGAYRVCR
jgi:hypothetical protein